MGVLAFVMSMWLIPWFITYFERMGFVGKDMNKLKRPKIAEMGGVPVIIAAVSCYILAYLILVLLGNDDLPWYVFSAILFTILGIWIIGILDDIYGIPRRIKGVLPLLIALPFAVIYRETIIEVFGYEFHLNYLLSIFIIAFMVDAGANASNMLEGYNGLGVGVAIAICIPIIAFGFVQGNLGVLLLSIPLLGALTAFYFFNRYPAKMFPGDTLVLTTGAIFVMCCIIGNFKELGVVLFIPMIINAMFFFIHARDKPDRFVRINRFGQFSHRRVIGALPHLIATRYNINEWQLSISIIFIQFIFSFLVIAFYY